MLKRFSIVSLLLLIFSIAFPEEGMYPLSELKNLDLKKAGLKIEVGDLYNPNGVSLIDALVRIGGCTGSFISKDGLIITNQHCVYGSVAEVSDTANNYLKNGFHAPVREKELAVKNLTVKITVGYQDISDSVLMPVANITDATKRLDSIRAIIQKIEKRENQSDTTLLSEISEMFTGKTYVLFRYKIIKDIRLVYVPPVTIGNFGGESDNWVWPRHTGDFSIVRAYVALDGSGTTYSEKNVPYNPKRFLKINPNGVSENDFVFILGYPGRTMRHQPSQFLEHQQKYVLPYISSLYDWQISEMLKSGEKNPVKALEFAGRMKGLANVTKNYKGKLQGLGRANIIEQKKQDEAQLKNFIQQDEKLKQQASSLFDDISNIYTKIFATAEKDLWLGQFFSNGFLVYASQVVTAQKQMTASLSKEEKTKHIQKEALKILKSLEQRHSPFDIVFEKALLEKMLADAAMLPEQQQVPAIKGLIKGKNTKQAIQQFAEKAIEKSKLRNWSELKKMLETNPEKFFSLKDPLIELIEKIYPDFQESIKRKKETDAAMSLLMPKLLEAKAKFKNTSFIPDANSTLRLTYGYVKGYEPEDAVYQKPFTTLKGEIEKGTDQGDYEIFPIVRQLYSKRDFGKYIHPQLNDVPVGLLYNLDTTGGNSGSPVMNANGELIGVNFDRAYTATINDYAWNESYSRSIAVDIRYVLWVLEKVGKADNVLSELGVK